MGMNFIYQNNQIKSCYFTAARMNKVYLIKGSNCSKTSLTRESNELSHTISPSLLRKKIPPIMFLLISSREYSLIVNFDYKSLSVSALKIALNYRSHSGKIFVIIFECYLRVSIEIFLSIILNIPYINYLILG
jgi:hypothetical protein